MLKLLVTALMCAAYVSCLPATELLEGDDDGDMRDPFWNLLGKAAKVGCNGALKSMCKDDKTRNDPFWNNMWEGVRKFTCNNVNSGHCKMLGSAIKGRRDEMKAKHPSTSIMLDVVSESADENEVEDAKRKVSRKVGQVCKRALVRVCSSKKLRRGNSVMGRYTSSTFCKTTGPQACEAITPLVKSKLPRFSFASLRAGLSKLKNKAVGVAKGVGKALKTAARKIFPKRRVTTKKVSGDEAVNDYLDDLFSVEMNDEKTTIDDEEEEADLLNDDDFVLDEKTQNDELKNVLYSVIRDNIANDFKKFAPASQGQSFDQQSDESDRDTGDFTENLKQAFLDEIDSNKVADELDMIDDQ